MKQLLLIFTTIALLWGKNPEGIHEVLWGASTADVQASAQPAVVNWREKTVQDKPANLPITSFTSDAMIAGRRAQTTYYFFNDQLFQATIAFNFDHFKNYDFNYNVFISVDKYYRDIRSETLVFVDEIYALLMEKYGKKQPIFLPLDPRMVLMDTDNYIGQERWNLRYHPSEYYKRILGRAFAQWKYPKTEINFAVNIAASDKRFDYTLSFISVQLRREIEKAVEASKSSGL